MLIYDMRVNHLVRPLGFAMEETVFSWKVREAQGKVQTAARIMVYADAVTGRMVKDTGWSTQLDSLASRVAFPLRPRTRYYWTVSVRTDADEEATGELQWFETGKRDEPWQGQWITCNSEEKRHPYFEKEIVPSGEVVSARLYICGLGLYEARYGGARIGEEYLTPYSNDYNQWVQAQTYDVTELLQEKGILSVLLGNGWYKARFGYTAKEDTGYYGHEWKLIAELHMVYRDGREEIIGTDTSWRVRRSNITFSNLYDGEHVDDTLGDLPAETAGLTEAPKGRLLDRLSPPVTIHQEFAPKELLFTPAGERVFDMGQEFTGIFSLRVHESAGTVIHIQTGEILQQGNFYRDNLRSALSEYYYTSCGEEVTLMPHFTFYGYRYVKVEGIRDLKEEDFRGYAFYSDVEDRGFVTTGHALLNQFLSNVRWGLRSNFVDVPTDCPQRDERMGWTGDAQVFSPTASYLTDSYAFYQKYLYDMYQEQLEHDGMVPDVVPSAGIPGTACVWGDAACIIPWNLYVFYGDQTILAHQYESMKAWVEYIRRVDGDDHGWRRVFHYGDWLALDHPAGGAEQVFGATDEEFIANLYYAESARLLSKAAAVLGRTEDEETYRRLAGEQTAEVKREYYSATGRCCIRTQTALILTLRYHLSVNEELTKAQLSKLFEESGNRLKTGFVGTPLLCNVLSDNGFSELAYELLLNEEFPGWLREVKLGATTVWERWNSLLDDGTISGISMNSMNHYAYGSVVEWIFRHAAGLNVTGEGPGGRFMELAPEVSWQLRRLNAVYDSAAGRWELSWELPDPAHVHIRVTVPFGCRARLVLPHYGKEENAPGAPVRELLPGQYEFEYTTDRPLGAVYDTRTPVRILLEHEEIVQALSGYMDLTAIPTHMREKSIRDLAERFGGQIGGEQLNQMDVLLGGF